MDVTRGRRRMPGGGTGFPGKRRKNPLLVSGPVTNQRRDRLAIAIAAACLALSLAALFIGRVDTGIRLTREGDRVVVAAVDQFSLGARDGVEAGMIVVSLNGAPLLDLPQYVPNGPAPTDADGNPGAQPMILRPTVPTAVPIDPQLVDALIVRPITSLQTIQPWDLARGSADAGWA